MDDQQMLTQVAQLISQGMISAVFIWAWWQERKERQEREVQHQNERNTWMNELIDLAREAYGLKARVPTASHVQVRDGDKRVEGLL